MHVVMSYRKPESKKTTEDVELERISLLQEETKKALELSRASHELVKKRHSHTGPGRKDGQVSSLCKYHTQQQLQQLCSEQSVCIMYSNAVQ